MPEDPIALKPSAGVCYYPEGVTSNTLPSTPTLADNVDMPVPRTLASEDLHWEYH